MEKHPSFLPVKYPDLSGSKSVEKAVRKKVREGGKGPSTNEERVEAYLDRLERLAMDPAKEQKRKLFGDESRPRALSLLREMVMNKYVRPNKEKMAAGAARVEERAARAMGIEAHYGEQELEQRGEIAVQDLEKSLDQWIAYLSDANEPYPTWFRYYAFRNVLNLGDYDKDKGEFTKRSAGSARLFPDIDRGALAYVEQMMEASKDPIMLERLKKAQRAAANEDVPPEELITQEKTERFTKLPFAKQYAEAIRQAGEITPEMREETRGKWVTYQKDTDPTALWASLQNKGTAWCTKGFGTAETQLKSGDFHVYYTLDRQGKPTIPRIAIRMQEGQIGEVRGIADNNQNLEGNMAEIAEKQMNKLPGADRYRKASADMKLLTAIEKKTQDGSQLTKDDLTFLYEINAPIEGFGYEKDPRINELRSQRNPKEDMLVIFECTKEQVAHVPNEIKKNTKAYVGQLEPGIFDRVQEYGIEHVYTSFPERRIRRETIEIGGKTAKQLEKEITAAGMRIGDYAKSMLESKDFKTSGTKEDANLVGLTVADLGFKGAATTDQLYKRAEELGLELCPAEVGPHYRLKYTDQPMNEWVFVGMKQIAASRGYPLVFGLERNVDGSWLRNDWAGSVNEWDPDYQFVFRLRKSKT